MVKERTVTLTRHKSGEDTTRQAIEDWQEAGTEAIIKATWELSLLAAHLRGEKVLYGPENRAHFEKRMSPWMAGSKEQDA